MKTSFRQYLTELNRRHALQRRLISLLCVLSLVVGTGVSLMLTLPGITASSADPAAVTGVSDPITDPMSNNAWIDYFQIGSGTYNTEFVGSVWTDKSVTTIYENYKGEEMARAADGNMLGVLSAIGSSMAITGRIQTPTDTMLILDLSSSMYSGDNLSSTTVQNMVNAVNESITTLLSLNNYNRIGITLYWGNYSTSTSNGSTFDHGVILLPLDRYDVDPNSAYLTVLKSGSKLSGVKATAVKTSTQATVTTTHNLKKNSSSGYTGYVAGTYAQLGVQNAREQFLGIADDDTYITMSNGDQLIRQPIFIFMSDGRPTSSHSQFATLTNPTTGSDMAEWGLDSEANRTSDASDFVFQLTAAYSKYMVKEHYGIEPLFYTLGLGEDSVSMNVMDPTGTANKTSAELTDKTKIDQWWASLVAGNQVTLNVYTNYVDYGWNYPLSTKKVYVDQYKISDSVSFPYDTAQQDYVTAYFSASNAGALDDAFTAIVNEIILKSIYHPTNVYSGRVNTSGDVSFVDYIGEYMEVKEMHGIMLAGQLHDGESFAYIFKDQATAESILGTFQNATDFGLIFWDNVIQQLNMGVHFSTVGPDGETTGKTVPAVSEAYDLISKCWGKQLQYTSATDYSNYLSWYADADNNYLCYWDDKDPNATAPSGAAARIRTYFFQHQVDSNDVHTYDTDIMYATVWLVEPLDTASKQPTGDQSVIFSVPASLLPTLKYFVKLDEDGDLISLHLGSVTEDTLFDTSGNITTRPIRLIYEVGLKKGITSQSVLDVVDESYLQANTDADGKVRFYSNEWERDQSHGQKTDYNTYSYFRPSVYNDRYYYVDDMLLYVKTGSSGTDADYVLYDPAKHGALSISLDLYTMHPKYSRIKADDKSANADGSSYIQAGYYWMITGDAVIENSVRTNSAGQYYVPAGTYHTIIRGDNRFARGKTDNTTGTLPWRNVPTQQTEGDFVLASTLGNNGYVAVEPKGQVLQKKLVIGQGVPYQADADVTFRFLLHEGDELTGVDYQDGAAVAAALGDKKVTLIELTVKKGNSESGVAGLYNLKEYTWTGTAWMPKSSETDLWSCIYGETYTVVELQEDNRFGLHFIGEVDDLTGLPPGNKLWQVWTFTYGDYIAEDTDANHEIIGSNFFIPWAIQLCKYDRDPAESGAKVVPGATFGLYSLDPAEAMASPPAEYAAEIQHELPGTTTQVTWYLKAVETTASDGRIYWSGLTQEHYLVVELEPAPGFHTPEEGESKDRWIASRSSATQYHEVWLKIANTPGVQLPETGGFGTSPYICIGSAIMVISACAMLVYHKKRKEEHA